MAESHREEIAKLEALYAGNPGGRVFVHLAEAYRKAGEHERARRILDEGLARHTDSASGYVVLGRVLADMQVTAEAEVAFRRVLELDGGNLVALRWLGDIARQSGRSTDAVMHYRELLIRNPSNEEVRDLVEIIERETDAKPAAHFALDTIGASDDAEADEEGESTDAFGSLDASEAPADAFGPLDRDETPADALVPPNIDDAPFAGRDAGQAHSTAFRPRDMDGSSEEALAGAVSDDEEAALTPPAGMPDRPGPDVSPWSAAPGQTGDAEEAGIEYDLVETGGAGAGDAAALAGAGSDTADDESDVIADVDDDDAGLELDELRRDDEAEPLAIHLLGPSYDGEAEGDEEYIGELDLSDLANAGSLPDADDYADETFVADLSAAGTEEPAPDELPGGVDVLDAGEALTLLPDEGESATTGAPATDEEEPLHATAMAEVESPHAEASDRFDGVEGDSGDGLSELGRTELAGAAEPAGEAQIAEVRRGSETGLVTETMAVLYRSQGFHDRAADVYRALLRSRPDDERLMAKLREAEEAATGARSRPEQPAEDETGEVWLRGVGAAWTAPDEDASDATPYAWTGEADDPDGGDPIGSYLQGLVSWKAGSGAWRPADTPHEESHQAEDLAMPDWLNGPGETEQWTPDSEPVGTPASPPAEADWTPDSATGTDPWQAAMPDEAQQPPATDATASDAWQMPADPGVAEPGEVDGDDTGGGWTPMDLDSDLPAADMATGAEESPAAETTPNGDSSEDDDLDMFRSWLQSLKK
ncbi:MAG: hypothetical protein KFH98_09105 [Gemmatimonadetes bacterium]|nr:hypothetical protein [Gemmatimonadota bacterium]